MNTGTLLNTAPSAEDQARYAPIIIGSVKNDSGDATSKRENVTSIGEYKGHAVINLASPAEGGRPLSFGLSKAKTILANLKQLEAFVKSEGKSIEVV